MPISLDAKSEDMESPKSPSVGNEAYRIDFRNAVSARHTVIEADESDTEILRA